MARSRDVDYAKLLRFRMALRRFERWSEEQARAVELTPSQHQLLLCVRGFAGQDGPTISDAAECLLLRHHSTVELVDRACKADLLERHEDADDARLARIRLTARGKKVLKALTAVHIEELRRLGEMLQPVITEV